MSLPSRTVSSVIGAALAVACASVLLLWLSSGDSSPGSPGAGGRSADAGPAGERAELEVAAKTPPDQEAPITLEVPPGAAPVVWVRAGGRVRIRTEPGGGELVETVTRRTAFGSPTVFGVVEHEGDWAGVATASLPNGELGWIKLDPARLRAGWTRTSIVVDLSERRAELYVAERLVHSFTVTIGAPGSTTPVGRFAVTDTFRGDLGPAYGCCAVAIAATQPNLPSGWLGGRRIAIHGTDGALGVAASNGCVRATDADVSKLVSRIDLGAPVLIQA